MKKTWLVAISAAVLSVAILMIVLRPAWATSHVATVGESVTVDFQTAIGPQGFYLNGSYTEPDGWEGGDPVITVNYWNPADVELVYICTAEVDHAYGSWQALCLSVSPDWASSTYVVKMTWSDGWSSWSVYSDVGDCPNWADDEYNPDDTEIGFFGELAQGQPEGGRQQASVYWQVDGTVFVAGYGPPNCNVVVDTRPGGPQTFNWVPAEIFTTDADGYFQGVFVHKGLTSPIWVRVSVTVDGVTTRSHGVEVSRGDWGWGVINP